MSTARDLTAAATPRRTAAPPYDLARVRAEFPILAETVNGKPLVYLDNAATAQSPQPVIDALSGFYRTYRANVHRGVHHLSGRATEAYEAAREKARAFVNAKSGREIVFTRGTTESVNLVAQSWGRTNLTPGDEVLITGMEHHSNIVPWQLLCEETGARLVVAPIDDRGALIVEEFERLLSERTKIAALSHVSNALGTINPVQELTAKAHAVGALVLLDSAQAAPHVPIDVQAIDCDFLCLSSHKVYGPTGIGILYGKEALLEAMPPYQGGGEMIKSVTFEKTTYNDLPHKFEAGTPHIGGVVGFGAALDYVSNLGLEAIAAHEHALLEHGTGALREIPGVTLIGTAPEKASILSFTLEGVHPHDVGSILDLEGVAIRTGHHCAQPVMDRFGVPATARASLGLYNTTEEIDVLAAGLRKVREIFA